MNSASTIRLDNSAGHFAWQWARHGQQWPGMAARGWAFLVNGRSIVNQGPNEHSFSILMLDARKFHQKIRLESENRNAMAVHGRPWLAIWPGYGLVMASNGRPWPGMVGHVRSMASQSSAKDPAIKHMATFGNCESKKVPNPRSYTKASKTKFPNSAIANPKECKTQLPNLRA